jgi:CRISPR-associated protein Csm3
MRHPSDEADDALPPDKPYGFVPLWRETPERAPAPPHVALDANHYSGWIELRLVARTPVAVLSGELVVTDAGDAYAAMVHRGGRPCLPGSSVRGVLRAIAEACSPSCRRYVFAGAAGGTAANPPADAPCRTMASACPACRLFGFASDGAGRGAAYRSRVRVEDFLPEGMVSTTILHLPQLHSPHAEAYAPDGRPRGRKFYRHGAAVQTGPVPVQAVPAGSTFRGRVVMDDLTREELAWLCFAMGLDGTLLWKLGYGKPAYLGTMQPSLAAMRWLTERYGQPTGLAADPPQLAQEFAATGCGWTEAPSSVERLRAILGPEQRGPAWRVDPVRHTAGY